MESNVQDNFNHQSLNSQFCIPTGLSRSWQVSGFQLCWIQRVWDGSRPLQGAGG